MLNLTSLATVTAAATAMIAATPVDTPEPWNVDRAHSEVTFEVRHFFTPVSGKFDEFDVELVYDAEDVSNSSVRAVIPVGSIDTNNEDRDTHLESPDFFGAEEFPNITFESTSIRRVTDTELIATGELTIKDVTREVELPITMLGVQELAPEMQEAFGGIARVAAFEATLEIDRNDFGVGTGQWAADAVVGKTVSIRIAVEANQQAEM